MNININIPYKILIQSLLLLKINLLRFVKLRATFTKVHVYIKKSIRFATRILIIIYYSNKIQVKLNFTLQLSPPPLRNPTPLYINLYSTVIIPFYPLDFSRIKFVRIFLRDYIISSGNVNPAHPLNRIPSGVDACLMIVRCDTQVVKKKGWLVGSAMMIKHGRYP